jgi:hypothetical protein
MTAEPMAHRQPGIHMPERQAGPNPAEKPQAGPHKGIGRRIWETTAGNLLPGRTERIPVTDNTVARFFTGDLDTGTGGTLGRVSETTLLTTLGYRRGTPEYDQAQIDLADVEERLRTAGGVKIIVERGIRIMERGDLTVLQEFATPRPAGASSTNPTRITTPEARRVDQALAQHAAQLKPPLQPKAPIQPVQNK